MTTPQEICQHPDLLVLTGSKMYGTERFDEFENCISDSDYRGFVLPPKQFLLGVPGYDFNEAQIANNEDIDHKVYSLKYFLHLLLRNDPQCLELLFAPEKNIIACTEIGRSVLDFRDKFLNKKFYWRILGYSNSEWRKANAVKLEIEEPPKSLDDIKAWIRDKINPEKEEMDQVTNWLTARMHKVLVPSKAGINGKRKKEYEKFGYCTSSASHSIRLLGQCYQFLHEGRMNFPRGNADFLRDIKAGKVSIEKITETYNALKAMCECAYQNTKLPEQSDHKGVWDWYLNLINR